MDGWMDGWMDDTSQNDIKDVFLASTHTCTYIHTYEQAHTNTENKGKEDKTHT